MLGLASFWFSHLRKNSSSMDRKELFHRIAPTPQATIQPKTTNSSRNCLLRTQVLDVGCHEGSKDFHELHLSLILRSIAQAESHRLPICNRRTDHTTMELLSGGWHTPHLPWPICSSQELCKCRQMNAQNVTARLRRMLTTAPLEARCPPTASVDTFWRFEANLDSVLT